MTIIIHSYRTMLWSALQATHLIHIDMEVATGLKAVQDIFATSKDKGEAEPVKKEEEDIITVVGEEEKKVKEIKPVKEEKKEGD